MKTLRLVLALLTIGWLGYILVIEPRTTDPAYLYQKTTFDGKPVFGKLNRDGTYSFYEIGISSGFRLPGRHITTLPASEAAKLH